MKSTIVMLSLAIPMLFVSTQASANQACFTISQFADKIMQIRQEGGEYSFFDNLKEGDVLYEYFVDEAYKERIVPSEIDLMFAVPYNVALVYSE